MAVPQQPPKRVRFIEDTQLLNAAGVVVERFAAGQVVELPATSAARWERRGRCVAALAGETTPEAAAETERPAKTKRKPVAAELRTGDE